MSHRLVSEVLANAPEDLTPTELLTLIALAESSKDHDRQAHAGSSAKVIGHKIRTTEGTVRNVLMGLRERGLIVALVERPTRGQGQNYYLPPLEPHHRKASLHDDAHEPPIAPPTNDANGTVSPHAKRHPQVTHNPVDNSPHTQPA